MGELFASAFLGAILGGIVSVAITIWVERLRSSRVKLALADPLTFLPRGPLQSNWRSLQVNVSNQTPHPLVNWWMVRAPAQQCRAEISFLRLDGTPFIAQPMIGRWAAGAPEPRTIHVTTPNGTVPVLTNPQELKTTVDIFQATSSHLRGDKGRSRARRIRLAQ